MAIHVHEKSQPGSSFFSFFLSFFLSFGPSPPLYLTFPLVALDTLLPSWCTQVTDHIDPNLLRWLFYYFFFFCFFFFFFFFYKAFSFISPSPAITLQVCWAPGHDERRQIFVVVRISSIDMLGTSSKRFVLSSFVQRLRKKN